MWNNGLAETEFERRGHRPRTVIAVVILVVFFSTWVCNPFPICENMRRILFQQGHSVRFPTLDLDPDRVVVIANTMAECSLQLVSGLFPGLTFSEKGIYRSLVFQSISHGIAGGTKQADDQRASEAR